MGSPRWGQSRKTSTSLFSYCDSSKGELPPDPGSKCSAPQIFAPHHSRKTHPRRADHVCCWPAGQLPRQHAFQFASGSIFPRTCRPAQAHPAAKAARLPTVPFHFTGCASAAPAIHFKRIRPRHPLPPCARFASHRGPGQPPSHQHRANRGGASGEFFEFSASLARAAAVGDAASSGTFSTPDRYST
jgi:hypothetical protein